MFCRFRSFSPDAQHQSMLCAAANPSEEIALSIFFSSLGEQFDYRYYYYYYYGCTLSVGSGSGRIRYQYVYHGSANRIMNAEYSSCYAARGGRHFVWSSEKLCRKLFIWWRGTYMHYYCCEDQCRSQKKSNAFFISYFHVATLHLTFLSRYVFTQKKSKNGEFRWSPTCERTQIHNILLDSTRIRGVKITCRDAIGKFDHSLSLSLYHIWLIHTCPILILQRNRKIERNISVAFRDSDREKWYNHR